MTLVSFNIQKASLLAAPYRTMHESMLQRHATHKARSLASQEIGRDIPYPTFLPSFPIYAPFAHLARGDHVSNAPACLHA